MKTPKVFKTLAVLVLVAALAGDFLYGKLALGIAMAEGQVQIFDAMRMKALSGSPREAAQCLEYVQNYYPSGTKQTTGSRLDRIVESARAASARDIVDYLRRKTGKNLGDDAASWREVEGRN